MNILPISAFWARNFTRFYCETASSTQLINMFIKDYKLL